jgi:CheY-specific phosphatase CheX
MAEDAVCQPLLEATQKALETMFFVTPDSVSIDPGRPAGELIASSLIFQGAPPGRFGFVVSDLVARTLAANFIGCDAASVPLPAQVTGVMGELANMICGAVLSEMESDAKFDLSTPESIRVSADEPGPDFTFGSSATCRFEFSEGSLVSFLEFGELA